ncbi:MAM and LDL-receptor class A domain-containing protein 1-like [Amphiura filiformis]|uniref:MAM and LDL-receptor class A domain-containing protein 1-like n=1 Tax=Amphiura filiformis TaxID=82378 RepID=UPI003B2191BB
MWGSGVDKLRVMLEDNAGVRREIWNLSGDRVRNWLHTNVTFNIPRVSSGAAWFTLIFEGVAGADQQSDIAIDTFKASSSLCRYEVKRNDNSRELPVSFDCSFDKVDICGQQEANNLFEWAWRMTTQTFWNDVDTLYYDWYLFVDSTSALEYGDMTSWISPPFKATSRRRTEKCITFKYLMDGEDIKFLHTHLRAGDGEKELIWSRYGNQGRKWRVASVTFSVVLDKSSQIIMEVQRGMVNSPWIIAINDVRVAEGPCYVVSQRPHVQDPVYPKAFNCSFETSSLCGFTQDTKDDFDWTHRYNTPFFNAPSTGNTVSVNHRIGACSGSSNYFLDVMQNYMTDIPDKGLRATLRSPKLDATPREQRCIGFYYYMDYGDFGTLRVYQVDEDYNTRNLIWKKSKSHGKEWNKVEISYNTTGGVWEYIEFEAEKGPSKVGDIAIDDFMLSGVSCEVLHTPERLPKALPTCSFNDKAMCGWKQSKLDDDFDWTRNSGPTPSSYTGPNAAHDSTEVKYSYSFFE